MWRYIHGCMARASEGSRAIGGKLGFDGGEELRIWASGRTRLNWPRPLLPAADAWGGGDGVLVSVIQAPYVFRMFPCFKEEDIGICASHVVVSLPSWLQGWVCQEPGAFSSRHDEMTYMILNSRFISGHALMSVRLFIILDHRWPKCIRCADIMLAKHVCCQRQTKGRWTGFDLSSWFDCPWSTSPNSISLLRLHLVPDLPLPKLPSIILVPLATSPSFILCAAQGRERDSLSSH